MPSQLFIFFLIIIFYSHLYSNGGRGWVNCHPSSHCSSGIFNILTHLVVQLGFKTNIPNNLNGKWSKVYAKHSNFTLTFNAVMHFYCILLCIPAQQNILSDVFDCTQTCSVTAAYKGWNNHPTSQTMQQENDTAMTAQHASERRQKVYCCILR